MSSKLSKKDNKSTDEQLNKKFIEKVINNYENLLNSIQKQIEFYKKEHENLKSEINLLLEENQKLGTQITNLTINPLEPQNFGNDQYKKITDEIIKKLRKQIQTLVEEKSSIENLWQTSQKIISNLETALREYNKEFSGSGPSIEDIKSEYNNAIQFLELNTAKLKEKLQKQIDINKHLSDCKAETERKLEFLEEKYQSLLATQKTSLQNLKKSEISLKEAKQKLSDIMKIKSDLEKSLIQCNTTAKHQIFRETEALDKVQDALLIAESALQEKKEAFQREQIIKEECDLLASTIGQVMEDAAQKVENEMVEIKKQYDNRINSLNLIIENLKVNLNAQTNRTNIAENRVQNLENQLKKLVHTNSKLDVDLQVASQTIIEMELKLEALESLLKKEEESNELCQQRAKDLQELFEYNSKLKKNWRSLVNDITTGLQNEIQTLKKDNIELLNENTELKMKTRNFN